MIMEHRGRATDIPEMVADLVKGFAVLARAQASAMTSEHAFTALTVVQSMLERAERLEWEESVDLLRDADDALNRKIAPPR